MYCTTVEEMLGGYTVVGCRLRSDIDLFEAAQKGLPKRAVENLSRQLGFTTKKMTAVLQVAERTLQRKKDDDTLDAITSEKILQVADIYTNGCQVFNSAPLFLEWLETENRALGGRKPLDMICSQYGAKMVREELGRISHGIFS